MVNGPKANKPHSKAQRPPAKRRRVDSEANAPERQSGPLAGPSQPLCQETETTPTDSSANKSVQPPSLKASFAPKKISRPNDAVRTKLTPVRPFPSVPPSSSATGPRHARTEGNNYILISRKTPLGAYLRRCKECITKDGYRTLHFSAMSAAIPTLLLLVTSLPETLDFSPGEITIRYLTGSVACMDEYVPEQDNGPEDAIRSELVERKAASLSAVLSIGDGQRQITGHEKSKAIKRKLKDRLPQRDNEDAAEDAMSTDAEG